MSSNRSTGLSRKIAHLLISLRGATTWQLEHELNSMGFDTNERSIAVTLNKFRMTNLAYNNKHPCECCRKDNTYWYLTDEGKATYS